ncbi:class I SAM-dependent methyltransferase [Saccharothrix violaceirubra]|uniref:SAM-dependent methyltransferase n=1 Tax=Saccharothrix violaceirubra TaxID=413306 RepID=A0A7W7WUE1_9PSEU|nr:class I SAM-dependent methyltransferase [Saccharothrix violaceirubra]MBB4963677.1 SAM-dependent methyltransferase [Saccharothrix violaceirubra]
MSLLLTGERTVPGIVAENYWFRRHEAAYLNLAGHCAGAVVLEAGCGEGYGAATIAREAAEVVALDYDAHTIAHVRRTYPALRAVRGNLAALPLRAGAVDVVASLQVVEHLWDQGGFLDECRRVLRPGGKLLLTTPNRITFSPGRDTPLNPFHTRELDARELGDLLSRAGFRVVARAGLRHGPRLRDLDHRFGGSLVDAQLAVVDDRWPADLLAAVGSVTAADFVIDPDDVGTSLDLVAVAVRP